MGNRAKADLRDTRQSDTSADLSGAEQLLFLTDAQLRQAIELMFFAYRGFTQDPDEILNKHSYGRAHHRALHFIGARPGLSVADLLKILGVTKQSLNRVLRELVDNGLVEQKIGEKDRRRRLLHLTKKGQELGDALAEAQRARVRRAFSEAGPEAVRGFRCVLEQMLDDEIKEAMNAGMSPES